MIAKTGVILSTVYYLLDQKAIAYKLECDTDYLLTFLNKREDSSKADSIQLIHKLCVNQDVQNLLLKEQNFIYLVQLCHSSPLEEIRSTCYKIFGTLAFINPSKQVIKQLFFQTRLVENLTQRLKKEQSEDVLCSIVAFLMKLTIVQEILQLMNHKKNMRLRRLAYAITANLLCEEELRKALMRQNSVDVIAKLLGILEHSTTESKVQVSKEETINALHALSNALQDNLLLLSFLQQKGHIALNQVFEDEDLRVKEACLCLYTRLAQDKDNNIMIVLESDLIYDVLSLNVKEEESFGVMRNMLILMEVMLSTQNNKAIEQMKAFDIMSVLFHIMIESPGRLGYLAMNCIGLLAKQKWAQDKLKQRNDQNNKVIDSIINAIKACPKQGIEYRNLLRGVQIFLLSFESLDYSILELDLIISLIQALNEEYDLIEDSTSQFYLILILKRLSEMKSTQISEIIMGLEQYAQQLEDAPSIDFYQQTGFVQDMLEQDIMKNMIFYQKDDFELTQQGQNQKILFYTDLSKNLNDQSANDKTQQEINSLKMKEQSLINHINEVESEKARLEEEIKTLIGVNYQNQRDKQIQTDLTYSDEAEGGNPQVQIKKLREEILLHKRTQQEQRAKIDYLSDRIIELEQDIQIRDKALQKLTQGSQLAEAIGSVKDKIKEDLTHKFNNFQTHIKTLEGVIDTNSKLIRDLTESVQERNIENQSLRNEDKIKIGKIETLLNKITTLEKQVVEQQKKETQMRVVIEKMIQERDKHFKEVQINLPELQLSTEQAMISELQEQLIHFKVENLKLQESNRKIENQMKKIDIEKNDLMNELERYQSKIEMPDLQYVMRQIKADPKSLDTTIAKINEALQYIDRNITRHNFKEQLLNFYEERISDQNDKYEQLLIKHLQQQTHLQICQSRLNQIRLMSPLNQQSIGQDQSLTDLIQQQWQQTEKHLSKFETFTKEQYQENKRLRVRLQETEEALIQYKKYVMFDTTQYERMFKLKNEVPLSPTELGIVNLFLTNQTVSEFQRLSRILDIIIKHNIDLEYKVSLNNSEKLRNEYHLIIEQREMEVRQKIAVNSKDDLANSQSGESQKIKKLEYLVQQIELDTQQLEVMNKDGNQTQIMVEEAFTFLNQIQDLINQGVEEAVPIDGQNKDESKKPINIAQANKTQEQIHSKGIHNKANSNNNSTLNKTQDQIAPKKKVQTTNLIAIDGKKPRFANDYNKQPKKPSKQDQFLEILQKIDQNSRDCHIKLSHIQNLLAEEQKIRSRQAADSLKEISILKDSLLNRQSENQDLINNLKKILLTKNELTNQLIVKDFVLSQSGGSNNTISKTSPRGQSIKIQQNGKSPQVSKLEGLVKVNNFVRKKELEAKEESDLLKHKLEKLDKERLSLTLDNKKLTEQIKYLQQLLKNQREQFRRGGGPGINGQKDELENVDIPEDDIVRFLVQIDELNQKNSELEYMLQSALQQNLEKEKLMRGTEELIEDINTKIEQIGLLIKTQIPINQQNPERQVMPKLPKMPETITPETVFERLNIMNTYVYFWYGLVQEQVNAIQQQKEILETMKPSNQTLTQAEHQAKLEKYLNIYSARIQTLSSIIASYQRHFKTLEDQIRELQGIPNINAMNQLPTQRQIENARIESLKRMINLKDILIKHQQNEIELIKKSIIGDKANEQCIYYVTQEEKEALIRMRKFDMQVKVIQDYERQMLMTTTGPGATESVKKGEEYLYLKQVNAKIQQDLINVKEVFQTNWNQNKINVKGDKSSAIKDVQAYLDESAKYSEWKEYLQRWMNMVQDLLQTQFDNDKCKFYIETLNQEIPIILSIMTQQNQNSHAFTVDILNNTKAVSPSLEIAFLVQKIEELKEQNQSLSSKVEKHKDRNNFLRSKVQHLQEHNILLKKFLHSKKHLADDFKHFYKQDLLQENESLRTQILSLTPYNEKLALECAVLRQQVKELNQKILKQDERHLREQELFQNLEQTLLDTQKKLIEKDSETIRMIKSQKETLLKGNSDQALELLIQTADVLNLETIKLREQNWQLSQNLKSKRLQLEQKGSRIKQGKQVLSQYEDKIRELTVENEKLKVLKMPQQYSGSPDIFQSIINEATPGNAGNSQLNKDKLIYELGKDGANTVVKFLDEIAHYKDQIVRLANEMQEHKVKNTTLMLLVQDKANKLQISENKVKQLNKEKSELEEKIEKLEFMYQKVHDDFISQQQALDVYVEISIPVIGRNSVKAFSRCIDNAKILALMLSDVQKQRNLYYESSIYYERQAHLLSEQLKVKLHEYSHTYMDNSIMKQQLLHNQLQLKINQGILNRYDKEINIINKIVQESSIGIESLIYNNHSALYQQQQQDQQPQSIQSPPKKPQQISAIDSPPLASSKKPLNNASTVLKDIVSGKPQRVYNFTDRSSIHLMLNSQLEINNLKAHQTQLISKTKQLQTQNNHNLALINYQQEITNCLMSSNQFLSGLNYQWIYEINNLKLQNIYLSRLCLYSYRANTLVFKRNDEEDQEQVERLMSIEIDKLKIENSLLQERTSSLELKIEKHKIIIKKEDSNQRQSIKDRSTIEFLERELQQQIEWNTQLEKEILSKSAQIDALSKIHNDFSQPTLQQLIQPITNDKSGNQIKSQNIQSVQQADDITIKNLRSEYAKLEAQNQKLHERIYLLENKNNQKEQKITKLQSRLRELEKELLQFDENENQDQNQQMDGKSNQRQKRELSKDQRISESSQYYISSREITMQQDIDEIWKKMAELNNLKNSLYDRNDDLRLEIDSFKTHFSKYEAQDFKKRLTGDSFQHQLYSELTLLREERDLLLWQLTKYTSRILHQQNEIEILRDTAIQDLQEQVKRQQEQIANKEKEVQQMKEQMVVQVSHNIANGSGNASVSGFDSIRVMIQVFEGGRLRRDKLQMQFENARLRRENDSLRKEVDSSKKLQEQVLGREFSLKKRLIELKNELVRLRVTYDMGEYQSLVLGTSSTAKQQTPLRPQGKKLTQDSSSIGGNNSTSKKGGAEELSYEKVRQYVEDLAVLRENLLKIEFRNIELEELYAKKEQKVDELEQNIKDLMQQVKWLEDKGDESGKGESKLVEIGENNRQVVDLQQRLMEEEWEKAKWKKRYEEVETLYKETKLIQEKYIDEVKEHQKLNTQISIMQKQIQDLQRPTQQLGIFADNSEMVFYDMLSQRFLTYLSLYLDDIRTSQHTIAHLYEKNRVLQDQLIRTTIQLETFTKERDSYNLLIDQLIHQKVQQVESDFVNTAQHEEGLSKLEVHIMNQRKKLVQMKAQMDQMRQEKEIMEQNMKAMSQVIKNLEKHSMEYNAELTETKDECQKLRGERERYEQRITFLWERLEFQEKVHHKVVTNNATLEQVIKVYKEEITNLKAFLHLNNSKRKIGDMKLNANNSTAQQTDTTKSHVMLIEKELVRLKNKDMKQEEQIDRLNKENDELKLYLRLADMIRKAVGISHQEREQLTNQLTTKKHKLKDIKARYLKQSKDKDKYRERVEFLEKQIMQLRSQEGNGNGFVKVANDGQDSEGEIIGAYEGRELKNQVHSLKKHIKELEAQNLGLRQQMTEAQGLQNKTQSSINNNGSEKQRQVRAITPHKIRDMQIKGSITTNSGNIGQRLNSLRNQQPQIQEYNNEFYYGQNNNLLDPLSQLKEDIQDAMIERQGSMASGGMKLPKIGNSNYVTIQQQQDVQPQPSMTQTSFDNKRNQTPLPIRMKATHSSLLGSTIDDQFSSKPLKTPLLLNKIPPRMNKSVIRNAQQPTNKTMIIDSNEYAHYQDAYNTNHATPSVGPQLNHHQSTNYANNSQNNFIFKSNIPSQAQL